MLSFVCSLASAFSVAVSPAIYVKLYCPLVYKVCAHASTIIIAILNLCELSNRFWVNKDVDEANFRRPNFQLRILTFFACICG